MQFDFTLPERFQLEYVGEDGKRHQPLMVHRALYGSIERFFGVLIEHYAGAFPVWLSPVQVAIIPIGEKHQAYANEVGEKLKAAGVRVHVDARNEKMNAKIREHAMQKVPFQLVLGDREMESHEVNVRVRGQEKAEGSVPVDAFVERVKRLIETKSRDAYRVENLSWIKVGCPVQAKLERGFSSVLPRTQGESDFPERTQLRVTRHRFRNQPQLSSTHALVTQALPTLRQPSFHNLQLLPATTASAKSRSGGDVRASTRTGAREIRIFRLSGTSLCPSTSTSSSANRSRARWPQRSRPSNSPSRAGKSRPASTSGRDGITTSTLALRRKKSRS